MLMVHPAARQRYADLTVVLACASPSISLVPGAVREVIGGARERELAKLLTQHYISGVYALCMSIMA